MTNDRLTLKIRRLHTDARLPARATEGASGLDLYACLPDGDVTLGPDPVRVPAGVAIEFPPGYDVQVRPRSGLSLKGVGVAFGTIDSDYRGEVLVTMWIFGSKTEHVVRHGDRIAQLVVSRLAELPVVEVDELTASGRGASGHGSTGS
ncbi:MAG: dUTP diphosphatase [Dehalococcoidia bacterium]